MRRAAKNNSQCPFLHASRRQDNPALSGPKIAYSHAYTTGKGKKKEKKREKEKKNRQAPGKDGKAGPEKRLGRQEERTRKCKGNAKETKKRNTSFVMVCVKQVENVPPCQKCAQSGQPKYRHRGWRPEHQSSPIPTGSPNAERKRKKRKRKRGGPDSQAARKRTESTPTPSRCAHKPKANPVRARIPDQRCPWRLSHPIIVLPVPPMAHSIARCCGFCSRLFMHVRAKAASSSQYPTTRYRPEKSASLLPSLAH